MDTNRYRNEAPIVIECPAEDLYDLVADVSQMGRWSPVCTGGSYDDDGPSRVPAAFGPPRGDRREDCLADGCAL